MEPVATLDAEALLRFAEVVTSALSANRAQIDALNVYPVPDGDTGTNMFLTVEAARDALRAVGGAATDLPDVLTVYSRAALMGARGNSGVILSQLIGALLHRIGQAAHDEPAATTYAEGLALAADAAYLAVGKPVEGTILSVARAAADAAVTAAGAGHSLDEVLAASVEAARNALAHTPEQLPLLRDAGVVDAGGFGLCVVLEAAEAALTGHEVPRAVRAADAPALPGLVPTGDLTEGGPAYEVMYLLDAPIDAAGAGELRARLGRLGDSVVVVGDEDLWNVHVHTDDVGAVIEVGLDAGRPHRIRVTHFVEQLERVRAERATRRTSGRAVVAIAAGDGLSTLFADAGARVIPGGPGRRPSAGEVLAAIEGSGAAEVIVLPNDPDSVAAAEAAARAVEEAGEIHVVVIPTRAQVQGLAALACHEPDRALDADVVAMTSAARGTRHGAITIAARRAMTSAGPCEPGDWLGVVQGDFAVIGEDPYAVALEVLGRLLAGGGELVTVVAGQGAGDLAGRCQAWVEAEFPGVDVLDYEGGQERYPLLLAVE
jgi:DAK2 domain fusion protein YloV